MADFIVGFAGGRARQQMEDRAALPLVSGESVLGELYVTTRHVRIRGFQWTGTGREGMLVLTNYRLFYCFYDQRSIALALEPWDVEKVELVPARFLVLQPRIVVTAKLPGGTTARRVTFTVPKFALVILSSRKSLRYPNPSTAEEFSGWLQQWLARGGAPDGVTRGAILEQRRKFFEADLAVDTRNALARLGLTLPVALCTGIAPIFGFLALREEGRLRSRAAVENAAVPPRVVWITRLGWAWIVIGGLLWALILYSIVFGPIIKE